MLLLSSVDSRRPQFGDASSEICPLPTRPGVGFRPPAFKPPQVLRGCDRLLWLLLAEVVTRWMWTRDGAKAERRRDGLGIHIGADVERRRSRSLLLLLLHLEIGMVDISVLPVLAVITPAPVRLARGVSRVVCVFWAMGRGVNNTNVSRRSWTCRAASGPSMCAR